MRGGTKLHYVPDHWPIKSSGHKNMHEKSRMKKRKKERKKEVND